MHRLRVTLFLTASLLAVGVTTVRCTEDSPSVAAPQPNPIDAGTPFADTTIAFTRGGQVTDCRSHPMEPDCADNPVLGPKDGRSFTLGPGDKIEVAFLSGGVLEHPKPPLITADARIWCTVPPGASAVVEVSYDGSTYETLLVLDDTHQTLELERIAARVVRFIRIVDSGHGGIAIDAIEALDPIVTP